MRSEQPEDHEEMSRARQRELLVEQFKALGAEFSCHARNACQISTAPSDSSDMLERVTGVHDKRCSFHGFSDDTRRPRAHREQYIDWHLREFIS